MFQSLRICNDCTVMNFAKLTSTNSKSADRTGMSSPVAASSAVARRQPISGTIYEWPADLLAKVAKSAGPRDEVTIIVSSKAERASERPPDSEFDGNVRFVTLDDWQRGEDCSLTCAFFLDLSLSHESMAELLRDIEGKAPGVPVVSIRNDPA